MLKNKNHSLIWTSIGFAASFIVIFLIAFLFYILGTDRIQELDIRIQELLFPSETSSYYALLPLMRVITSFGSFHYSLMVALAFACYYIIYRSRYLEGSIVLLSFLGMWGINALSKYIVRRERPDLDFLISVSGYSFPSGHAMVAAGFYGSLLLIAVYSLKQKKGDPMLLTMIGITVIFLLGFSRIYLGVHYPSDVLTGFTSGGVWVLCINKVFRTEFALSPSMKH
ncbi:phosphatase PAP2 family protein [Paenibacillus gallinarum]|uniref:Phosphatase PAP2 family protein n=1 Tax=Paenibacillus gallinarum TaxID=2762232 RepID=A0ABR8T4J9_9BACL|nr:phosphatase PAP2 family protein [Paenibacillus gallinarum]MBD7970702.1 phosphatase PAP2 family protein [Paenibacillus gallinarum]